MKIAPHDWNGKRFAGEVSLEWGDDDALLLDVTAEQVVDVGHEGIVVNLDSGAGSLEVVGMVKIAANVAMTEAEARELHAELGRLLDA